MRRFDYFLFENFDADAQSQNPLNPRKILNSGTDALLSHIASYPAGQCPSTGDVLEEIMIREEILRKSGDAVVFNTPVFLKEDAQKLKTGTAKAASRLADRIAEGMESIYTVCGKIDNGFSVERNLYHILCGMVFDGFFFDYLEQTGAVAISHLRPSGMDYLSVIYEKCEELDALSNGILCSYNRFTDGECSLESFGDAMGNRHDFYRFFRLLESGELPEIFVTGEVLLRTFGEADKGAILAQVKKLIRKGDCVPDAMTLLSHFGYVKDRKLCIPVYTEKHTSTITHIAELVEDWMGEAIVSELTALSQTLDITAVRHGVLPGEIANELYHLLFGSINEELVTRGLVEEPPYIPGEGRYLRCIQY